MSPSTHPPRCGERGVCSPNQAPREDHAASAISIVLAATGAWTGFDGHIHCSLCADGEGDPYIDPYIDLAFPNPPCSQAALTHATSAECMGRILMDASIWVLLRLHSVIWCDIGRWDDSPSWYLP